MTATFVDLILMQMQSRYNQYVTLYICCVKLLSPMAFNMHLCMESKSWPVTIFFMCCRFPSGPFPEKGKLSRVNETVANISALTHWVGELYGGGRVGFRVSK